MDWLKNILNQNETVIYQTRSHRYIFISPLFIMLCGFLHLWFLFIGLFNLVFFTCRYFYYEYIITDCRIIIKKGLFYIRTEEIMLDDSDEVIIRRSWSEKFIRGGSIYILAQ